MNKLFYYFIFFSFIYSNECFNNWNNSIINNSSNKIIHLSGIRFNDDNEREYYEIIREGKNPVFGLWRPDDLKCWLDTVCVEGVDTRYDDSEAEIAREQYGQDSVLKIHHNGCHETLPETRNRNLREASGT